MSALSCVVSGFSFDNGSLCRDFTAAGEVGKTDILDDHRFCKSVFDIDLMSGPKCTYATLYDQTQLLTDQQKVTLIHRWAFSPEDAFQYLEEFGVTRLTAWFKMYGYQHTVNSNLEKLFIPLLHSGFTRMFYDDEAYRLLNMVNRNLPVEHRGYYKMFNIREGYNGRFAALLKKGFPKWIMAIFLDEAKLKTNTLPG